MKKNDFLKKVNEILEIDIKSLDEEIKIDSIGVMSLIAFIDENFDKTIKMDQFDNVKSLNDLIKVIGEENFE